VIWLFRTYVYVRKIDVSQQLFRLWSHVVYSYIYICVWFYIYMYIYIYVYIYMYVYIYIFIHVNIYIFVYIYIYIYIYICIYVCVYMHIHINIHTCIYLYIYHIYISIHIYSYAQIFKSRSGSDSKPRVSRSDRPSTTACEADVVWPCRFLYNFRIFQWARGSPQPCSVADMISCWCSRWMCSPPVWGLAYSTLHSFVRGPSQPYA